jgi:hypothetical protein
MTPPLDPRWLGSVGVAKHGRHAGGAHGAPRSPGRLHPRADADRKRFRRLVSTLREDLYLAERDGEDGLEGLALIAYVRGLGPSTAIVRELRGSPEAAALLLACAETRAAARGCTRLELQEPTDTTRGALDPAWHDAARILRRPVTR